MTTKRIRFLRSVPPDGGVSAAAVRQGDPRPPSRVVVRTALTLPGLPPPTFAAVEVRWFPSPVAGCRADAGAPAGTAAPRLDALEREPAAGVWSGGPGSGSSDPGAGSRAIGRDALEVTVDEVVARGADALAARWADGGERYTMMSFGRRNPALTRVEFVERWRAEAGRLGSDRIPDELRGLAYVQDHPLGDDPPLDAINEVWFDDLGPVLRRAEWFAARPVPAELMSPEACWSLVLREVVVLPTRPSR